MLTRTLERIQASPARRAAYGGAILLMLAVMLVLKALRFKESGFWYGSQAPDFAAFHIVAQRVWHGDVELTYQFAAFMKMQLEASGGTNGFMPWTYPPQFDLLIAPLAFLPGWAAYALFTTVTLVTYILTLRAIARRHFAQVLIVLFPAIAVTLACGQNGFLTGTLMGLLCLHAERRPVLAGIALGTMVIKPHLAIAAGVYMLLTRRWTVILSAATVVAASSLLCTLVFGPHIWLAWMDGIKEAAGFLEEGRYPLFRMISAYAALYKAGFAGWAFWGQTVVAVLAVAAVALGVARAPSRRFTLGVVAMTSVMISPYAYDYDLPIVGIGLALMLPGLATLATPRERDILYGLVLLAGAYGLLQSARLAAQHVMEDDLERYTTPAVAGIALIAVLALLLRLLLRVSRPTTLQQAQGSAPPRPAHALE